MRKKGLLVLSHDNEDLEAIGTRALLVRAGFDVTSGTYEDTLNLTLAHGTRVEADAHIENLDLNAFDFLIIPGGKYVKNTVDEDTKIKALAKHFHEGGRVLTAICAGPRFLGQAGLLEGKTYTAFTGAEVDMPGATLKRDKKAVRDGNIITARGAGAVYDFAYEITKHFKGEKAADTLLDEILY